MYLYEICHRTGWRWQRSDSTFTYENVVAGQDGDGRGQIVRVLFRTLSQDKKLQRSDSTGTVLTLNRTMSHDRMEMAEVRHYVYFKERCHRTGWRWHRSDSTCTFKDIVTGQDGDDRGETVRVLLRTLSQDRMEMAEVGQYMYFSLKDIVTVQDGRDSGQTVQCTKYMYLDVVTGQDKDGSGQKVHVPVLLRTLSPDRMEVAEVGQYMYFLGHCHRTRSGRGQTVRYLHLRGRCHRTGWRGLRSDCTCTWTLSQDRIKVTEVRQYCTCRYL
jgi:hypothetical protein